MNQVLTDEEIRAIVLSVFPSGEVFVEDVPLARAIEKAVLEKFEQVANVTDDFDGWTKIVKQMPLCSGTILYTLKAPHASN